MVNQLLAKIFYEMSAYLEMEGIAFKPQAYENAARLIEGYDKDMAEIYEEGGLEALKSLPEIGQGIAEKIEEYIKTGKIKEHQHWRKKYPLDIQGLMSIEGLGPKTIKLLYQKLGVKNLADLEKAAKKGLIKSLPHFGEKTEKNILQGIEFVKRDKDRFILGYILPTVNQILDELKLLKGVERISVAGSVRRMKETIGDVDILVVASKGQALKIIEHFVRLPYIVKVWAKGLTKASIRLSQGFDVDLRVVKKESFGSALQYFTGNKAHSIATRKIAQEKGLKLNEYGVFRKKKKIAGQTEEEVYQAIGLPYIPPELRENQGEIEAALIGNLPKIIQYNSIKGDLHMHSVWSDGAQTIEEMAKAAVNLGHQYILITDHAGHLKIANGLDEKRLIQQMREIDRVNSKLKKIHILKGAEVDILPDGRLAIKDDVLSQLDIVIASVHSNFKMGKESMTKRISRAICNPHVDIIGHPTGRIIQRRPGYQVDWPRVFKIAKENKTALEVNAYPDRLDLPDVIIKQAIKAGVKLTISTDSHSITHLNYLFLGIAQARRGWATKEDILNTRSLKDLLAFFKNKKA